MTRLNSYYLKCDAPATLAHTADMAANSYSLAKWTAYAKHIAQETFGDDVLRVEPNGSHNRHLTFRIHCQHARYFLRADISGLGDDYMLAETHLMMLLRQRGVPVPEVLVTDVSQRRYPLMYQIVELVPYEPLHLLDQRNELSRLDIAQQLGQCMARIHKMQAPGFGYLDTSALQRDNQMRGLDGVYADYFLRRLDDHLHELGETGLLGIVEVDEIRDLLHRHLPLSELSLGSVVHRDLAFWNLLGDSRQIHAIIDWEDAVLGDPADDLGVFNCF